MRSRRSFDFAQGKLGPALQSFLRSGDVLGVIVLGVTVLGRPDAQEKLEGVAEIVSVVTIERIGAVVDCELGAEADVDAVAVRQVADVTERVSAHWKNFGFIERLEDEFVARIFARVPSESKPCRGHAGNLIRSGTIAFCLLQWRCSGPRQSVFDQLVSWPSGRL